jgi:hypothetical protein
VSRLRTLMPIRILTLMVIPDIHTILRMPTATRIMAAASTLVEGTADTTGVDTTVGLADTAEAMAVRTAAVVTPAVAVVTPAVAVVTPVVAEVASHAAVVATAVADTGKQQRSSVYRQRPLRPGSPRLGGLFHLVAVGLPEQGSLGHEVIPFR